MNRILILGAGLSSSTLISYLLDNAKEHNWNVRVGDLSIETAEKKVRNSDNGEAFLFDVQDKEQTYFEVGNADVVVSMLPAFLHYRVAQACVDLKKHMVTASYVSDEIRNLNKAAKEAGIAILNELGVDPGIDHMSAMKEIDHIKADGGEIISFKSSTGGLVAPEYDNNPWNYKFTWNPRNVVLAGQGVSKFIEDGRLKYIPYQRLFERNEKAKVLEAGEFEVYANRDSLAYREAYGLKDIRTMLRGTMRRPGFIEAWNIFVQLGMTDDTYKIKIEEGTTWADYIRCFLEENDEFTIQENLCAYLGVDIHSKIMDKLRWLGVFSNKLITLKEGSPAEILQSLLSEKWKLEEDDKDMIVMQHEFIYTKEKETHKTISSLVVEGENQIHTAMSITVGMPVAIAVKKLMLNEFTMTGVHIPTHPDMYLPILAELAEHGIKFVEDRFVILSSDS
jgi:saccharopine dehydrogenase (NADP+, L-glutamate forming)